MGLIKYPVVVVEWDDPMFSQEFRPENKAQEMSPLHLLDVGFLVHEDDENVHIAGSHAPEGGEVAYVSIIQKRLIRGMHKLPHLHGIAFCTGETVSR